MSSRVENGMKWNNNHKETQKTRSLKSLRACRKINKTRTLSHVHTHTHLYINMQHFSQNKKRSPQYISFYIFISNTVEFRKK